MLPDPLETVIDLDGNYKWLGIKEKKISNDNRNPKEIIKNDSPLETIKEIKLEHGPTFQCKKCGAIIKTEGETPKICYEDQGGCNRGSDFKILIPKPVTGFWKDIYYKDIDVCDLDLYNTIMPMLKDTIVFKDENEYLTYFLWIVSTWKYECFQSVPYALFVGPIKSGKTRGLDLIRELGYHCISGAYISIAAIPRLIEKYHATITLDEASDAFWKRSSEGRDLTRIFKAGYRKGQKYIVADNDNPDSVIVRDVFGYKAMASEKALDTALHTRSVAWWMQEATPTIPDIYEIDEQFKDARSKLLIYRYICDNPPELPLDFSLTGRIREIFAPLVRTALSLGIEAASIIEFARKQEIRQQEEIFGTLTAQILGCIYDKMYDSTGEHRIVYIKDIATECDESTQNVGYKLRDLGIIKKRSKEGMFISLENQDTIDRLDYYCKKFGIAEKVKASRDFQTKI